MRLDHLKLLVVFVLSVWLLAACSIETESQKPTRTLAKTQEKSQPASRNRVDKSRQKSIEKGLVLPHRSFEGIWLVEGSSAEFKIDFVKNRIKFSGKDDADREGFKVSNLKWDQSSLKSTIQMPSTNHTLKIKLTIVNENELRCRFSGDAVGEAIWKRKESVN